ncbi:alpha/beta fold hydrolase [Actinomadura roseirufa]|uniref:alpha/beta fold hydrolase n=1 Tax=Actinomadura roseirufa TaxID=2094049 RepID=UPI001041A7DB|nr:alpha/beta hydrolase [Actinomadura roseirufa]
MTELAVERWGDSGPLIVMVHGSLSSAARAFSEQRVLADDYRIIAPYRRGYPPSPATDRIDPDRDAEEIAPLLGSGAHLVGTSMGGVVAMRAAALVPDAVLSLTVIEPPALPNAVGRPAADRLREALRVYYKEHGEDEREAFVRGFLRTLDISPDEIPSPLPPLVAEAVRNLRTEHPWDTGVPVEKLAAAAFPKLVVTGGGTPGLEDVGDALAEQLPARRVLFDGSPHAVQRIGDPFNAELRSFLAAAEAGTQ